MHQVDSTARRWNATFRTALARPGPSILRDLADSDPAADFANSTSAGLSIMPRRLQSRFLYDVQGSQLFDLITEQPEYYLTRIESAILAQSAHRISRITGPAALMEFGSGYSAKTGHLLRAWLDHGPAVTYVPVDVSESALYTAWRVISGVYPTVRMIGLNAEYHRAFPLLGEISPAVAVFLGSTIGNFDDAQMEDFLTGLSSALSPGDFFLAGFDLVKEPATIEAAYNDKAGVSCEFTRNLFARMNRELGSSIDLRKVRHLASYDPDTEQVNIYGLFTASQTISIARTGKIFPVAAGEQVQTEISRKFRIEKLIPFLEGFGLVTREIFTDPLDWYALVLLQKPH